MSVTSLQDVKAARAESHAEKVKALFRDHPELAESALIISPDGAALIPEGMDALDAAALLDKASFAIKLQTYLANMEQE